MIQEAGREQPGIVFHWPRAYDFLLRLIWGRRESRYRERVLELAGLTRGEALLDVGCGTGTLALAARRLVGRDGYVAGVDASPDMLQRARAKCGSHSDIEFVEAPAQNLPFADLSFDAVVSTTVVHCLPEAARTRCFREMARVLKPGGRLLIVDFGGSKDRRSLFGHMGIHRRYSLADEIRRFADAGLVRISEGPVGFSDLYYILACPAAEVRAAAKETDT